MGCGKWKTWALGALWVWTLSGCGSDQPPTPSVAVSISPAGAVSVGQAKTQNFMATVTGTSNTAVSWSVQENGGGVISSSGSYIAPFSTGVFHVKATSAADATKSARVEVTVRLISATMTIGSAGGTIVTSGGATLNVPRDALTSDVDITVSEGIAPLPSGLHPITPALRCEPDGLSFSRPVGIRVPLPAGTTAAHLAWSRAGTSSFSDLADFEDLGGAVSSGTLVGSITHCSAGGAIASAATRTVVGVQGNVYLPPGGAREVVPVDSLVNVNHTSCR